MEERTDIIDHLKDFNILTTQLLSVEAKIEYGHWSSFIDFNFIPTLI